MKPASNPRPASPVVRLEIRVGSGRPTLYEVGDGGFLIGAVPGCDLRLPGTNLAPVICLVSRHQNGASLRKLAPVQPVSVNGKPVAAAYLNDGDQITVGAAEVFVAIEATAAAGPEPAPPPAGGSSLPAELVERVRQFEKRVKELVEKNHELESNRAQWLRRRDEIET